MESKLTLQIEEKLIVRAKSFAERTGKSVSQIVADFFELLPDPEGSWAWRGGKQEVVSAEALADNLFINLLDSYRGSTYGSGRKLGLL